MTETPETVSEPNADERKLWFDYIKTLNERQLHETQRSGITTYVLIASLVGLFYRFGPQIPQFIGEPETVKVSVTVFVLLTFLVSSLFMASAAIELYCAGEIEFRAIPRSSEPLLVVVYWLFALVIVGFICLELWVATSSAGLPKLGKYALFAHAGWLGVNIVYPLVRYREITRKAKQFKNLLPKFNPFRVPPWVNLVSLAATLVWLVCGSVLLIAYLKPLPNYGLRPIKAASITLIVILIVGFMLLRSISEVTQRKYFGLERDIVLNRLTPAEIRSRYLRDLNGPDMAQWLDDALATLDVREERLQRAQDSANEKLKVIQKINVEYSAERRERARLASEDLTKAIGDSVSHYDLVSSQTEFFSKSYRTQEETEILKAKFLLWEEKFKIFKEKLTERFALLDELKKLR